MDFVGKRHWMFLVSGLLIVGGVASLLLPRGLNVGLEFTGGSSITLEFEEDVQVERLRTALADLGHEDALIQRVDSDTYFVRTRSLDETTGGEDSHRSQILDGLESLLNVDLDSTGFFSVSPSIASETVRNAAIIVLLASMAILFYITWAFRRINSPFTYGIAAIIALIHDVVMVLGLFSILGRLVDLEVNAMFIAGVLTIIGYSVHDTIVVFDRIRENLARGVARNLVDTVNLSIQDTLGRSLNTSLTMVFTIMALLLFGGVTIQDFLVVLFLGITVGTYSSIWIASQLLLTRESGGIVGLLTGRGNHS